MPRPKVSDACRRRIAKACLDCQAAKQKCDGLAPCVQCLKRGKSHTCAYSTHQRLYGRRRKRISTGPGTISPLQDHLRPSNQIIPSETEHVAEPGRRTTDVTIPKLPHNLYDTNGRVLYLGDCAALSFLQNIQELIEGEGELTTIAQDVGGFPVYEEVPPVVRDGNILAYNTMDMQDIKELINVFFASTCGILDIFGKAYLEDLLSRWADGSLETNSGNTAVLYLTIAYAAQARSATIMDVHRAQSFYDRGRQVAALELTNDPSVETVQAFILVSLYMLGCSRRNGAYFNLGIAISAAKSLGFHRDETNAEFPQSEGRLRRRIWRTLRYHDMFFCAMMGRTSAILTTDSTVLDEQLLIPNPHSPDFCQELGLLESARAFSFLERTVNEVYTKQTVPLGLLQRICEELQEASSKVPGEIRTPVVTNSPTGPRRSLMHILRNASVACNYYFSMMLLTRPFLITSLRTKHNRSMMTSLKIDGRANHADSKIYTDITHGAVTCIDSATKTVRLLHELMVAGLLFNNMPLAVAWTFVAALTVCSAYFGRLDGLEDCERAIQLADEILQHFARNSPQARRYRLILEKLSRAALDYVKSLERKEPATKNKLMPELFRLNSNSNSAESACTGKSGPASSSAYRSIGQQDRPTLPARRSYPPVMSEQHQHEGEGEPSEVNSRELTTRRFSGLYNRGHTSTTSDTTSLLDLAHSFHHLNNPALDMGSYIPPGELIDSMFDFENTESIWDLSWGGAIP